MKTLLPVLLLAASIAGASEIHVAVTGKDANPGTLAEPLRTIQHAADLAQPGDTVTVHAGVYRERVTPPRGGESDANRIVYQAAAGEKVTITGSEPAKGWEKAGNDTWKLTLPSKSFGACNPFADLIRGDWFDAEGRAHHTGSVYLDGAWLPEAASLDRVLAPAGATPMWFAKVDGAESFQGFIVNIASLKAGDGPAIPAVNSAAKHGTQPAPCDEGGQCAGYIRPGDWLRYDNVDFGSGATSIGLRVASSNLPSEIELRLDGATGELLGKAAVAPTGGWQKWATVKAAIKPVSGKHNLCVVFHSPRTDTGTDKTTIWAQFKGVDPNAANVEIAMRPTVFTPSKTGINYITLRGFTLRNAATNWAPPSAGQFGIVSAYWCKGWIIENNDVAYSRCCGIALGKYSDEFDNTNAAGSANPYTDCVHRALANGWNKAAVGSHIVRNNRVSFCGQTGIVGSMGCAYSTITGNEIHDIHLNQPFAGEEMAGIKFHGAIDVTISDNHIYRCGSIGGIWLDWMGQGTHVTGNLMHDNAQDFYCEMQHGPIFFANNLFLSRRAYSLNSQGMAFAHNLIAGSFGNDRGDGRVTPVQVPHSTEITSMYPSPKGDSGDDRYYNNILVAPASAGAIGNSALPNFQDGNVAAGADAAPKLKQEGDGWYLTFNEDPGWRAGTPRKLVTTELLGVAKAPNAPFENADGSPIRVATDYFGRQRDLANPFPGPIEPAAATQPLKVWPK